MYTRAGRQGGYLPTGVQEVYTGWYIPGYTGWYIAWYTYPACLPVHHTQHASLCCLPFDTRFTVGRHPFDTRFTVGRHPFSAEYPDLSKRLKDTRMANDFKQNARKDRFEEGRVY